MTPARVWVSWMAANVVPSVAVSLLLTVTGDALGVNRAMVVAYIVLLSLVAALQALVWARWRAGESWSREESWRRWAFRTIGGLVLAMFVGVGIVATLDGLGHEWLGLVAGWSVAGGIVGATQAVTLGASTSVAMWWLAASVAGWATAAAGYSTIASAATGLGGVAIVRWLVGGLSVDGNIELGITALTFAVSGVLTGAVLARVSRHRLAEAGP